VNEKEQEGIEMKRNKKNEMGKVKDEKRKMKGDEINEVENEKR
jgi:hypothetical protein